MKTPLSNPLEYRRLRLRAEIMDRDGPQAALTRPEAVASFCAPLLDSPQEVFFWLGVDARKRVCAVQELFRGTADSCLVHPREVFMAAVAVPAVTGVFLVHNHPSGNSNPSDEDLRFFELVSQAGELLQIPVLDCFVLGSEGWWSREVGSVRPISGGPAEYVSPVGEAA
jgi:DNA repair protein RadC